MLTERADVTLTEAQMHEIAAMYAEPANRVWDIAEAFGISISRLYRVLERQGVAASRITRAPRPNARKNGVAMAVTVDKEGLVISAQRDERSDAAMPAWEITYQGVMRVRATSIEEAIHRAKSAPEVRKVVGAVQALA